ncbi:MAG: ABC transporter permease [Gemmatimonadota bacterium]|nr:ABC transporter permease [Gemmatimonadota bacterium]
MRSSRVFAIARREWRETVGNKSFLVVSLLVPAMMVLLTLVPGWIAARNGMQRLPDAEGAQAQGYLVALMLIIFLFLGVTTQSQALLRSVMEERGNRMVEILLSSVRPIELLTGKMVGYAAVSVTQFMVWLLSAVALSAFLGMPSMLRVLMAAGVRITVVFVACYAVGYLIYASLYTVLASIISAEREANLYQQFFALLLVSPFIITLSLAGHPNDPTVVHLTWVPILAPSLLLLRSAFAPVPIWTIAGALAVSAATGVVILALAARLFRSTTLLATRRTTWREMWRGRA